MLESNAFTKMYLVHVLHLQDGKREESNEHWFPSPVREGLPKDDWRLLLSRESILETQAFKLKLWSCGDLNMLGPGHGTIRRYGLVGVGVALLEEVCHCRDG